MVPEGHLVLEVLTEALVLQVQQDHKEIEDQMVE